MGHEGHGVCECVGQILKLVIHILNDVRRPIPWGMIWNNMWPEFDLEHPQKINAFFYGISHLEPFFWFGFLGIEPVATLYHWDLPEALEQEGGWLQPRTVEHFADYAALCFQRLGKHVPLGARSGNWEPPISGIDVRWFSLSFWGFPSTFGRPGRRGVASTNPGHNVSRLCEKPTKRPQGLTRGH